MATDINILIKATDQASPAIKKVEGEVKGLGTTAKNSSSMMGGLGNILKTGFTAALVSVGAAVGGLAFAFKDSFAAAKEAADASKQLDAVLKSTGGAAGVTAEQAKDLAGALMDVTNFGDDAIVSGENMLLTFTNIGKDVFPRATETMLDMSQALGTDLKGSAIQLGKALNDPIAGVGALSRVGVTFTDTQKDMIETMVNANDVAGAQTLILDELSKEFGGSARAMADPITQLANAWGEVQEVVGTAILPIFNDLAQKAMPYVKAAAEALGDGIHAFTLAIEYGKTPLQALSIAIGNMIPSDWAVAWSDLHDGIMGTLNTITGNVQNAMGWIRLAWDTNWGDIRATWDRFSKDITASHEAFWIEWHRTFDGGSKTNLNDWEGFIGGIFGFVTKGLTFGLDLLTGFFGNWNRTTEAWHALTIGDWATFWSKIGGNFTTAFTLLWQYADIFDFGLKERLFGTMTDIGTTMKAWWQGIADAWNATIGTLTGVKAPTFNLAVVNPANVGTPGGGGGGSGGFSGSGTVNNITVNTTGGYDSGVAAGDGIVDALRFRGH